jgi:putative ABC transport system permease protein
MISYSLWQSRFGGSTDWIGKTIALDSQPYTLIGVLPSGFQFLQAADIFVPFEPWAHTLPDDRDWHPGIIATARLKQGVPLDQARAEMKTITARLAKQYPGGCGRRCGRGSPAGSGCANVRPALIVLPVRWVSFFIACAKSPISCSLAPLRARRKSRCARP